MHSYIRKHIALWYYMDFGEHHKHTNQMLAANATDICVNRGFGPVPGLYA